MPDIASIRPIQATPANLQAEQAASQAISSAHNSSLLEEIDAVANEQFANVLGRFVGEALIPGDDNFQLNHKNLEEYTQGIDQQYWNRFMHVRSDAEALAIRSNILGTQQRKQVLADAGGRGVALSIAGSITDPSNIAISFATAGAGSAVTTTSRLANMTRFGLIEASAMAGVQEFKRSQDPTLSGWDTVTAAGMGLGGGLTTGFISQGTNALTRFKVGAMFGAGTAAPIEAVRQAMNEDRTARDFVSTVGLATIFGGFQGIMSSPRHKAATRQELFDTVDAATATQPARSVWNHANGPDPVTPATVEVNLDGFATPEAAARWKAAAGPDASTPPDVRLAKVLAQGMTEADGAKFVVDAEAPHAPAPSSVLTRVNKVEEARAESATVTDMEALDLQYMRAKKILSNSDATPEERSYAERTILSIADKRKAAAEKPAPAQSTVDSTKAPETLPNKVPASEPINGLGAASPSTIAPAIFKQLPDHGKVPGQWDFDARTVTDAFSWGTTGIRANISGLKIHIGTTRFGMGAMVGQSPFPEFRFLANSLAPDYLAKTHIQGNLSNDQLAPNNLTAAEWQHARASSHGAEMQRTNVAAFESYKKNGGTMDYDAFATAASEVARSGQLSPIKELNDFAAAYQGRVKSVLEAMQRHQVPGSELVPTDPKFVPRHVDPVKMHAVTTTLTYPGLVDGLTQAIRAKNPGMKRADATFRAERWIEHQTADDSLASNERGQYITFEREADLRESIKASMLRTTGVIDYAEIESIVKSVTKDVKDPAFNSLKMRLDMDETSTFTVLGHGEFRVTDLLENNLELLEQNYMNSAYRHAALGEIFREFSDRYSTGTDPVRITSIAQMMQELARIAKDFRTLDPDYNYAVDLNKIETLLKMTAGVGRTSMLGKFVNLEGSGENKLRQAGQNIKNAMFIRTMGHAQSGLQNLTDVVYATSEGGAIAAMNALPQMVTAINQIRTGGPAASGSLRILEAIGAGNDMAMQHLQSRGGTNLNESSDTAYLAKDIRQKAVSNWLAQNARRAFLVSGQTLGTAVMQKIIGTQIMQRFVESAVSGKIPNKSRLMQVGLDEAMAQRISGVLRDPAVAKVVKGKLVDINELQWQKLDPESFSRFLTALHKELFRLSVTPHPQQFSMWMDDPVGQVTMQLRKWGSASYEAKLGTALQNRDFRTARSFLVVAATGAALYAAMIYKDSLTKEDPQAYRDERLTPEKVFLVGATRGGYLGMLPAIADAALAAHGEDPVFSYGRASGVRGGSLLGGSPTADALDKAWKFYQSARRVTFSDDYSLSQYDLRNASQLIIPRFTGVSEALDYMINNSDLPATGR